MALSKFQINGRTNQSIAALKLFQPFFFFEHECAFTESKKNLKNKHTKRHFSLLHNPRMKHDAFTSKDTLLINSGQI